MTFRLPNNTMRTAVIGRTGTGKTVFASWLLSEAPFDKQPYVIIDYKRDGLIGDIDFLEEIRLGAVPKHSGLYVVRPLPHEEKEVEAFLWNVYKRERVGLYCDETTMLPKPYTPGAVRALFVQGRSKRIPIIACTQRPSGVSPYLFSEADFFAIFHVTTDADIERCASYGTPWAKKEFRQELPEHYCRWFDVSKHFGCILSACPPPEDILQTFRDRLKPRRNIL